MKLVLIGGAGVRALAMVRDLIRKHTEIPIQTLYIHDIVPERLHTIGKMIKEEVRKGGSLFQVELTTDFQDAVRDADFIYTAIRVGGEQGRVIDERVPLRLGILGQETTGAGGFAMALRTIPVMLDYAEIIEREAPNAWVINFTNPAGLITEALSRHSRVRVLGICDAPSSMQLDLARFLNVHPASVHLAYFGLNHLGWIRQVLVNGRDRLPEVIDRYDEFIRVCPHMSCFSVELIRRLEMLPNEYLYYYYYREQAVQHILNGKETRGEQINRLNEKLFSQLQQSVSSGRMEDAFHVYDETMQQRQISYMSLESGRTSEPDKVDPSLLQHALYENEGYAGLALSIVSSIIHNRKTNLILNVPNRGAIADMLPDDIVEVPCVLDANGALPLAIGSVPESCKGLLHGVKQYERLTVSAAVSGSYDEAWEALAMHPLIASESLARQILDGYIEGHASYLSHFKKRGS
ncbi:glycoside hydrolase [Paenibacillus sp. GCM10027628]|uniref:family 4 glycosyl hydrolase n=1 Tax=Paenibacillus sp. GCM10027628 TaxID=3273413 RepID=UPI00363ECC6C